MKKLLALLLTVTMLCGTAITALAENKDYPQRFYDVPKDHWAFEYIAELVDRGVIAGYEDGSFKPNNTVTRAEFAKIMVCAASVPTTDNNVYFTDMVGHWAIPYVNAARNYLTAYSDNTYRPNQAAVREDVTMAMVRLKGYDVSNVDFSYLSGFTDTDSISNNVKAYVAVAVEKGLISGFEDNTFRGQGTLTRAEAATLLWKAFQYGNDNKVTDTSSAATQQNVTQTTTTQNTAVSTPQPVADTTPTPEPVADTKPYKIETLTHMVNKDIDMYTAYDNNGTIYYVDGNKIYSLTENGSTKEVFDIDSMTVAEDFNEKLFVLNAMCCDTNGKLYIAGGYSVYDYNLYEIKNGTAQDTSFECIDVRGETGCNNRPVLIVGDNYVCSYDANQYYSGYDRGGSALRLLGNVWSADKITPEYAICAVEYNDNIIVADKEGIYEYDYNTSTKINDSYGTVGLSNTGYVVEQYGKFIIRSFNNKSEIKFSINDCVVNDKSSLNSKYIAKKLFLMPDNSIIFYDTTAQAFRKISVNIA